MGCEWVRVGSCLAGERVLAWLSLPGSYGFPAPELVRGLVSGGGVVLDEPWGGVRLRPRWVLRVRDLPAEPDAG